MKARLEKIYLKLFGAFGPQGWWPAETPFEVMLGAILTQSTSWKNVEKAIANIRGAGLLSAKKLRPLSVSRISRLIRPAGYFNVKAQRLKYFLDFFFARYSGSVKKMARQPTARLRQELLDVHGIGEETADSILLYALCRPVFVVDAYTKRIFQRHGFLRKEASYAETQRLFAENFSAQYKLCNEYHALIVRLGKDFCLKNNPRCGNCPLNSLKINLRRK